MIRGPLSALAGTLLALVLFGLLAWLVTPPEEEFALPDEPIMLNSLRAPEAEQEPEPPESPPEAVPAAPRPPAAPPPMPEPAPPIESPIALPDPELPPEPIEPLELDTTLPELAEAIPEPTQQPAPAPAPAPTPRPAEQASPSPAAASAEPTHREPVEVGAIAPTRLIPPEYPPHARRRGLEGHVELEFMILPDGRVDASTIRVTDARPRNVFEDAARRAVARWRFEPAEGLRRAYQRLEFQLR
ncbi:MAG: TonB family protein [Halomonas sp.]|uniref:TonB family protein n=1 Tax=Halomonas sp. TaxID=1486246 RepID=UPI0019F75831|nr:TonB family protein [Halomonas sp.]MBE0488520.1 TonB family protein [Halomonas sp.]